MKLTPVLIQKLSQAQQEYIVKIQRHLHIHPEPSGKEEQTSKLIESQLKEMGVSYTKPSGNGIIARITGGKQGKTVLLRADMDALPMQEAENNLITKKTCVSSVPDCTHACGHDGHTAMLLGAARVLWEIRAELVGDVLLVFEDAEEISVGKQFNRSAGPGAILETLGDTQIDTCYAIHLYAGLESGKFCVDAGPRMAGIARFDVELTGKGGHGSRPDQAISPLFAAAYTITNLANSWVNEIDVTKTVTLGIGSLHSGKEFNSIPSTAKFDGSIRFFDLAEGEKAVAALERIVRLSAEMHRCAVSMLEIGFMSSCTNDKECAAHAQKAISSVLGSEVLATCEPWFASETFNYYLAKYPGVLAHLGIANARKGTGALHHNAQFELDEDVLWMGVASMVAYTAQWLNTQDGEPNDR